jgi:DUF917 family protein
VAAAVEATEPLEGKVIDVERHVTHGFARGSAVV